MRTMQDPATKGTESSFEWTPRAIQTLEDIYGGLVSGGVIDRQGYSAGRRDHTWITVDLNGHPHRITTRYARYIMHCWRDPKVRD